MTAEVCWYKPAPDGGVEPLQRCVERHQPACWRPLLLTHPRWRCSTRRCQAKCSPNSSRSSLGYVLHHVELKQYACTPRHLTTALAFWTTSLHHSHHHSHTFCIMAQLFYCISIFFSYKIMMAQLFTDRPKYTCKAHLVTPTMASMAPKQLLMQSLIACVDILWNTHTHNPSCFSTLLRSMAETESSEGPPHCHYKDIMFSVQDDTTFGLRFCNITMLHGGHQQNHSCLAAVVRLHRPEKATALWDVVYLRYPAYLDWCWSKLNKLHKKLSSKCYLSFFFR